MADMTFNATADISAPDLDDDDTLHTDDRDMASVAFDLVKSRTDMLDTEDRLRFNFMLAGMITDFEKDIIRSLEMAFQYLSTQAYDSLRQRIVNHLIVLGTGSQSAEKHSRSRSFDRAIFRLEQPRKRRRTETSHECDEPDRSGPSVSFLIVIYHNNRFCVAIL